MFTTKMPTRRIRRIAALCLLATLLAAVGVQAQGEPIKIGFLIPLTGPLATPGQDMRDGFSLFWEQVNHQAGGRKVQVITADTTCNPDQALTQARRVVHQEKVHFMVGPLCGHEGPAVAQVSKETGVPLLMDTAGADTAFTFAAVANRRYTVRLYDVDFRGNRAFVYRLSLREARDKLERDLVRRALRDADGNMTHAAERLGMQRPNLYRKMRELGMEPGAEP